MIIYWAALLAVVETEPAVDCSKTMNQPELNDCAAMAFLTADEELNAVWGKAMTYVREQDREGSIPVTKEPTGQEKLRQAQRAWLVYRDAHCTVEGYLTGRGNMEPMIYNGCRTDVTKRRTEELRSLYSDR